MLMKFAAVIIVLSAAVPSLAQHLKSDEAMGKNGVPLRFAHLFQISKETNKNRVIYEAALNANCEFNIEKPVKIYWAMGAGHVEELNFFERRAFPITFYTRTANVVTGDIKAIKDKKLRFPLTLTAARNAEGICVANASAPYISKVVNVYLSNFSGIDPKNVSVQGLDRNGQAIDMPVQRDGISLINQIEEKQFAAFGPLDRQLLPAFHGGPVTGNEHVTRQIEAAFYNLYPTYPVWPE